jgi:hypothetical protein
MTSMLGRVYKAKTASGTAMSSAQSSIFFSTLGNLWQLAWVANDGGFAHR